MANQPHTIEVEILPDGSITGQVKGVTGPSCSLLSSWLDELGKVEVDLHTADYRKPGKQVLVGKAGAGK